MAWRSPRGDAFLPSKVGGMAWLVLVALMAVRRFDLGTIELLFLFAPLVIVPLGFHLIQNTPMQGTSPTFGSARVAVLACALTAAASFLMPVGIWAALAAAPWLLICLVSAVFGSLRIFRHRLRLSSQVCYGLGQVYLLIGGIWLVLSRIGMRPLGFYEPIVLLTAVHFHYAGFAAPILAGALLQFFRETYFGGHWTLSAAVGCVLAGPALLAAGFVLGPRAKLAAALVLVIGEIGLAAWTLAVVGRVKARSAQVCLALSAVSLIAGMLLAGAWALGEYPLQPMLNIPQMARIHGTVNAFGFVFCGVLGWTLRGRAQAKKE